MRVVGQVPIGGIIPFHKSLAGVPALPAEFVECNGQTLVDAGSPLNGQVIPNLNNSGGAAANRFLRGATTSGGVGGAETHFHDVTQGSQDNLASGIDATVFHATNAVNHLPPYMNVVWIIRIK